MTSACIAVTNRYQSCKTQDAVFSASTSLVPICQKMPSELPRLILRTMQMENHQCVGCPLCNKHAFDWRIFCRIQYTEDGFGASSYPFSTLTPLQPGLMWYLYLLLWHYRQYLFFSSVTVSTFHHVHAWYNVHNSYQCSAAGKSVSLAAHLIPLRESANDC